MDRSYSSPLLSMPTIKSRKFPFAFNTFAIAKSLFNVVPLDILLSMVAAMVSSRFDPSVRCKNSEFRIISMSYLKSCNIHSFVTTSSLSTCDFNFSSIVLPMFHQDCPAVLLNVAKAWLRDVLFDNPIQPHG